MLPRQEAILLCLSSKFLDIETHSTLVQLCRWGDALRLVEAPIVFKWHPSCLRLPRPSAMNIGKYQLHMHAHGNSNFALRCTKEVLLQFHTVIYHVGYARAHDLHNIGFKWLMGTVGLHNLTICFDVVETAAELADAMLHLMQVCAAVKGDDMHIRSAGHRSRIVVNRMICLPMPHPEINIQRRLVTVSASMRHVGYRSSCTATATGNAKLLSERCAAHCGTLDIRWRLIRMQR